MAAHDINTKSGLLDDIISNILLRIPVKSLLRFRSVSKSWLSLISSSGYIETHLSKSANDMFSWLPKVIIYNIFLRLHVKTLLRLRSVSKSWLSLISSSEFIKTHLRKSTNDPHFSRHHLLLSDSPDMPANSDVVLESHSLYSLLNEPVCKAIECNFTDVVTDVLGYCNGLVCLRSCDGLVFFWNPSTRKLRRLPIGERGCSHGFGYDEVNDDFKVFVIFGFRTSERKVSVYSSKSDSWRTIGDLTFATCCRYDGGYFAHGAIHWVFKPQCHLPKRGPKCDGSKMYTLNTFGESLSLLYDIGRTHADFWVLKKCGLEESWTKLFSIPYVDELMLFPSMKPICTSVNGDITLFTGMDVVLYNPRDNTFKDLLNTSYEDLWVDTLVRALFHPILYIEICR